MAEEKSRLIYSTDKGIPRKGNVAGKTQAARTPPSEQVVYVRLERKGRAGKSVSLIEGLRISARDRETLLKQLKTRLGTGGTLKNEVLELQGDHCDTIITLLQDMGYRPKREGG